VSVVPPAGAGPVSPPVDAHRAPRRGTSASTQPAQPALGLLGLLLVVPIAVALAIGAGGEGSVRVLAPLITYSLPLVVMVAFWWEDWPGTRARAGWAGWVDTLLVVVGAILLTGVGQAVVGHLDPRGIFDPTPGAGHVPTFPATLPLGGLAFVAMLQLTLVGEGWPLRRMRPVPAGLLAVVVSWALALVLFFGLVEVVPPPGSDVIARDGPVPGAELGTALVLIGAWQVLCFVTWRGWPFATVPTRAARLATAHVVVIGGGLLAYVVAHTLLGLGDARTAAVAGCFIAAGLTSGMLLEGWLGDRQVRVERVMLLLATLALTAALAVGLEGIAGELDLTGISADDWVEHAALNALATSIILHVAIGRRWPFLPQGGNPVPS
jgi:hypothetical protein